MANTASNIPEIVANPIRKKASAKLVRRLNELARAFGSDEKLARAADTSTINICRWRTGRRVPTDESIRKLELAAERFMRKQYLRPDIEPWLKRMSDEREARQTRKKA